MNNGEQPTRVEQLWFPPETIVIRAEDKIFQVSRAVLAARSSVFRDMLQFPQPTSEDNELIDGNPVVRLHDSSKDVTAFLTAIFDSSYFMPHPAHVEIYSLLGILRLANKYDVQYLYRRALTHLLMAGWYTQTAHEVHDFTDIVSPPNSTAAEALSIAAAAAEVGAQWLLPWAYYTASTFNADQLLPLMDDERLSQHARKCLDAHVHMVRGTAMINEFLSVVSPCPTAAACGEVRRLSLVKFFISVREGKDQDPIYDSTADVVRRLKEKGLCDECCAVAETYHKEAVSTFWDKLPSLFGLPPWAELRAMKHAAMGEGAGEGGTSA
ncbi:hypothetical protein FB451DRAFT_1139731 [Mycena latifolia]|nr:hypothetical protein FB451DRAFT_1139731 [Mycena latifolia]